MCNQAAVCLISELPVKLAPIQDDHALRLVAAITGVTSGLPVTLEQSSTRACVA
jgi:hypothetical protein